MITNHSAVGDSIRRETFFALLLAIAAALAVYLNGRSIGGPFIFGDELEYFSYGRDIFTGASLASHTQYGPLYPAIIALILNLGDAERAYGTLRIFNIAAFASWVIPALLLARESFAGNDTMRLLFPAIVVSMPFSGLSYIGWADTVHYALFLWAAYLLWIFFREPRIARGVLAGVVVGMLFHSKPGAGLVTAIAAMAAALAILIAPASQRRVHTPAVAAFAVALLAVVVPGAVRNMMVGLGITGYSHGSVVGSRIATVGNVQFAREVFSSLFYQLTYVFVVSYGLLCVLAVVPLARWQALPREVRGSVIFVSLCMTGISVLSAVGMSAFPGLAYWMPAGRYLSVTTPLVILLGLHLLRHPSSAHERWGIALAAVLLGALAARTSPLFMLAPYGFVNNTEMAIFNTIFDRGHVMWRHLYEASTIQLVGVAACFGAFGVGWALLWPRRAAVSALAALLFAWNVVSSMAEHRYVGILGESQTALNESIRYLARSAARPGRDVAFDKKMEGGNVPFMSGYWLGSTEVKYLEVAPATLPTAATFSGRYLVSGQLLGLPVAFRAGNVFVYSLAAPPARP